LAENKDIIVPTAGNKKLQPTLGVGQSDTYELGGGKTTSYLGKGPTTSYLGKEPTKNYLGKEPTSSSLVSEKGAKLLKSKGGLGDLSGWGNAGKDGPITSNRLIEPMVNSASTQKRDVDGDGPKSTLRPSTKNSSAFGRSTPFSGWFPMKFKSATYDSAVGGLGNPITIPAFGLNPVSFTLGSTTIQGLNFNGGYATMDVNQNSTAPSTTYSQAEDSDV